MFYSSWRSFLVTYSNARNAILGCGCARPRHCNRSPVSTAHLQPGRRWQQAAVGIGGVETKKWEIPLFPLPHHSEKELKSGISHSFPGKYRTLRPRAPRTGPHVPPLGSRGGYLGPLGPYVLCFLRSLSQGPTAPGPPTQTHREIKNTLRPACYFCILAS